MAEGQAGAEATAKKSKTEYTPVTMTDGRVVQFAGKRKVNKETLFDTSKIEVDEAAGIVQLQYGAISIRFDFVNGETRTQPLSFKKNENGVPLVAVYAGHGGEQKFGDEFASPADQPLSPDDMVVAFDDLAALHDSGKWGVGRAAGGGGVSGASLVVKAIMEATGKDLAFVKAYLQKKLDGDPELTRRALYDSFRVAGTKTGEIIKRLEDEKNAKNAKVDANAELAEMSK